MWRTDRRTDRRTDWTIHRAAWSQLKTTDLGNKKYLYMFDMEWCRTKDNLLYVPRNMYKVLLCFHGFILFSFIHTIHIATGVLCDWRSTSEQPWRILQWRHNGHDSVSNHQPYDCLLNHLFRCKSKKTSKPRVTGLCAWNSPVTGEFPAQMASNAENVSIWWCHHEYG